MSCDDNNHRGEKNTFDIWCMGCRDFKQRLIDYLNFLELPIFIINLILFASYSYNIYNVAEYFNNISNLEKLVNKAKLKAFR